MAAESNLQDALVLVGGDTLAFRGEQVAIGTGVGAKSIVLSNDAGALHLVANPTAQRTISFQDTNGTVVMAGGSVGLSAISAGTTRATSGELVFSNSNGVSFGMNGQTITASVTPGGGGGIAASAGTQSVSTGTVVWANSNGISFGMSNSNQITASYNAIKGVVGGTGGFNISNGTMSFSDANGVFWGLDGASNVNVSRVISMIGTNLEVVNIRASGAVLEVSNINSDITVRAGRSMNLSAANNLSLRLGTGNMLVSNASGNITVAAQGQALFTGSVISVEATSIRVGASDNTIGFFGQGGTGRQTITGTNATAFNNLLSALASLGIISNNATMSAFDPAFGVSAGTQSVSTGTVVFANSNGVTFGMSNSNQVTASVDAIKSISAGTTRATGGEVVFSNSNGVSFGMNGNTITATVVPGAAAGIGAAAAGTQTQTSGTLAFVNSNGITFGMSNSSQITASYSHTGVQGLAAGTQTATSGTVVFANSNGVTFGMSGSSQITASVNAAGGGVTLSGFNPYANMEFIAGQAGQGTLQLDPESLPAVQFDRVLIPIINTNSSNSSGSHTLSFWFGVYTRNASTLSLYGSASASTALTHSGTAGSYSLYSGIRLFSIPMTSTLTAGDYWVGLVSRTTSGGANGTYSNLVLSNLASNFLGQFGSSHNTTYQFTLGLGLYTATTSAMPASIAFSQIRGSDSLQFRPPLFMLGSGTV